VLPAIFHFIANFKMTQITMMTDIDKYLSFVLSMFLIFGIAFETPVLVFILIYTKILPIEMARKIRKYVFVGCFVIAAIVTPPDVFSQTMLALPLYVLYEIGLVMGRFINKTSDLEVT
jgi:sec-independent protein translocase protein TatC